MIKSLDARYVATLPRQDRLKMTFVQRGKSDGVDIDLIQMMRMGNHSTTIEALVRANIRRTYEQLRAEYTDRAKKAVQSWCYTSYKPFQPMPEDIYDVNYKMLTNAFTVDFEQHKEDLLRELQSVTATQAIASDHQRQVVKRCMKADNVAAAHGAMYSFVVCGDYGKILNYVLVPDVSEIWTRRALDEICRRHQNKPDAP